MIRAAIKPQIHIPTNESGRREYERVCKRLAQRMRCVYQDARDRIMQRAQKLERVV